MLFNVLISCAMVGLVKAINLTVAAEGGNATSSHMYGLMFEDINHSGDGGIYAELIQNRAFQGSVPFPPTIEPWDPVGNATLTLQNEALSNALPFSVQVAPASSNITGKIGLANPGWWGIPVEAQKYSGSFWALGPYTGSFTVSLISAVTNETFASLDIPATPKNGSWVHYQFSLEPETSALNVNNTFVIEFDSAQGPVNFNLISLFPPTYKDTPNGMRPDLMNALHGLNPSFLRMPGGNNIEGDASHYPWRWNETIGPLTERPGRPGTWGYQNTDGLGLIEYFNWCIDLDVEPLLAVWAGMYLVTNDQLTEEELVPWVQDTMNELEFLLGGIDTTFGAMRASLGYAEPFDLKYIEVGNEDNLYNGETSYAAYRFPMFYDAIHAKYPNISIVSSTGDLSAVGDGSMTDYHIYTRPDFFVCQFGYFDNKPRTTKILIGEYAMVQGNVLDQPGLGVNWNLPKFKYPIWVGAVSEAVWSLGIERNGDVTFGMSYAPGFQNLNSYEWSPDLISFTADPAETVVSTSYRVIELFSSNRYNATVPVTSDTDFGPAYWVAGVSEPGEYTFKTAIYNASETVPFSISFDGIAQGDEATLTVLTVPEGGLAGNSLVNGTVNEVVQKDVSILSAGPGGVFEFDLENYSVAVLTT